MCRQGTARCFTHKCNGFAQTLPLIPCENRPIAKFIAPGWFTLHRDLLSKHKGASKRERKSHMDKLSKRRKKAEAGRTKVLEGNINGTGYSAPVEVDQNGESSRMAGSRGAVGGGFVFDYPFLTSEETNWDWQNERRTELVSDSDEMMVDNCANEEDGSTNIVSGCHVRLSCP